ncbi:MAG: hypothetical protein GPOALKHO_001967 [Sodalis sp.]|nr:MAG: hypothetical protein GPOALKHO_001967 [Sodalis sp.]
MQRGRQAFGRLFAIQIEVCHISWLGFEGMLQIMSDARRPVEAVSIAAAAAVSWTSGIAFSSSEQLQRYHR